MPRLALLSSMWWLLSALMLPAQSSIRWEDYPAELDEAYADRVKFGYLIVPENHADPQSPSVEMAFTVVKSEAEEAAGTVIFLPGGPGGAFSQFAARILASKNYRTLLTKYDVVLIDPRGCGLSKPVLCDNLNTREFIYPSLLMDTAEVDDFIEAEIKACLTDLKERGIDFQQYSSLNVAHDVEALRQALGVKQWLIKGHSYGSRYGQSVIWNYPHTVKSAILSGLVPVPTQHLRTPTRHPFAMRRLLDACAQDPDCQSAFPNLEADFKAVMQRLEANPLVVPAGSIGNSTGKAVTVSASYFVQGFLGLMYFQDGISIAPALIDALGKKYDWLLPNLLGALVKDFSALRGDAGLIIYHNDYPFPYERYPEAQPPLEELIQTYTQSLDPERRGKVMLAMMDKDSLSFEVEKAQLSEVPVWLLSGNMDPVTTPADGDSVQRFFPNSRHTVVPGYGHDVGASLGEHFVAFYDNPNLFPEVNAAEDLEPLRFATDLRPNRGIATLLVEVNSGRYLRAGLLGGLALMGLVGLLAYPIARWRQRAGSPTLVWLVPLLSLGWLGAYGWAVMDTLDKNPLMLALGLPGQWDWLPWLGIAVLATLGVSAWQAHKHGADTWRRWPWLLSWGGGAAVSLFLLLSGVVV